MMLGYRSLLPRFGRDPSWFDVGRIASERPHSLSAKEYLEQLRRQAEGVVTDEEKRVLSWYPAMEVEAGRNEKAPEGKLYQFAVQAAGIIGCPVEHIYRRFGDGPSTYPPHYS